MHLPQSYLKMKPKSCHVRESIVICSPLIWIQLYMWFTDLCELYRHGRCSICDPKSVSQAAYYKIMGLCRVTSNCKKKIENREQHNCWSTWYRFLDFVFLFLIYWYSFIFLFKKKLMQLVYQGLLHNLKALRMMGLVLHPQNGKELVATLLISQDATSKIVSSFFLMHLAIWSSLSSIFFLKISSSFFFFLIKRNKSLRK